MLPGTASGTGPNLKKNHSPDKDLHGDQENPVEDIRESLEQINTQVARCHRITAAILKFGRKNDICHARLDPGTVIPEILALVENTVKLNGIDLKVDIPEGIPGFSGDAPRFQQVMLNLINNAVDAVTQRHGTRGGVIEVAAAGREAGENGGGDVEIQVRDNGCGIHPDHMNRIFSPFSPPRRWAGEQVSAFRSATASLRVSAAPWGWKAGLTKVRFSPSGCRQTVEQKKSNHKENRLWKE